MGETYMEIGVCGLGYTGSGAVMDLLKEYYEVSVVDEQEFAIAWRPDGLGDLAYNLQNNHSRYMSCDLALKRFRIYASSFWGLKNLRRRGFSEHLAPKDFMHITDKYIDNITQVKWKGTWQIEASYESLLTRIFKWHFLMRLYNFYFKKYKKSILHYPIGEMRLSINHDKFYDESIKYIEELLLGLGCDLKKKIALNQAFAGDSPEKSFCFYRDPYAIIVDKDPRDLYILAKMEIGMGASWIPTESVEKFIMYYKIIHENMESKIDTKRILHIKFEDLVYKYEVTIKKIELFLGLQTHSQPLKYFDPNVSINNTQLYEKYPELHEDIVLIEKSLPEYLYPYYKYPRKLKFGKSF